MDPRQKRFDIYHQNALEHFLSIKTYRSTLITLFLSVLYRRQYFRCTMANELVSANQITVCTGCSGAAIVLSGISHDTDN